LREKYAIRRNRKRPIPAVPANRIRERAVPIHPPDKPFHYQRKDVIALWPIPAAQTKLCRIPARANRPAYQRRNTQGAAIAQPLG